MDSWTEEPLDKCTEDHKQSHALPHLPAPLKQSVENTMVMVAVAQLSSGIHHPHCSNKTCNRHRKAG